MIDLKTAVFSVKEILEKRREILLIVHDADDEWQFLPGTDVNTDDIMIVSFQNIINVDETVPSIMNLPKGFEAKRSDKNSEWSIQEIVD